eukprot:scaffold524_cov55-Attheya_sp.AAC.3
MVFWFKGVHEAFIFFSPKLTTNVNDQKIELNKELIVSGVRMETCASSGDALKSFCFDALPDFDEHVATDIRKSSNVKMEKSHHISKESSIRANNRFRDKEGMDGCACVCQSKEILHPCVEKVDTPFMSKAPRAIWHGGYGTSEIIGDPLNKEELRRRYVMVLSWLTNSLTFVAAEFLVRKGDALLDEMQ